MIARDGADRVEQQTRAVEVDAVALVETASASPETMAARCRITSGLPESRAARRAGLGDIAVWGSKAKQRPRASPAPPRHARCLGHRLAAELAIARQPLEELRPTYRRRPGSGYASLLSVGHLGEEGGKPLTGFRRRRIPHRLSRVHCRPIAIASRGKRPASRRNCPARGDQRLREGRDEQADHREHHGRIASLRRADALYQRQIGPRRRRSSPRPRDRGAI